MVATVVLLNAHVAILSKADFGHLVDLRLAGIVLDLVLTALARIVLFARLAHVHRLIVCSAHREIARDATEDVGLDTGVVDLAGGTS